MPGPICNIRSEGETDNRIARIKQIEPSTEDRKRKLHVKAVRPASGLIETQAIRGFLVWDLSESHVVTD